MRKLNETKRERFIRLAEIRTNNVLEKLRILGGCANHRMYEYSPIDIEKIKNAIDAEFSNILLKFSEKKTLFSIDELKES